MARCSVVLPSLNFLYQNNMITREQIEQALAQPNDLLKLDEIMPKYKRQFLKWYPDNMAIIQKFEKIAYFLKINGKREVYGARHIWEHIRWNTLLESKFDEYKLPSFACAPTSRVVMHFNEDLQDMFFTSVTNPAHPLYHKNVKEID